MNKIYLIDIETIPNRYSCEWKIEFPKFLKRNCPSYEIITIEGRSSVPEAVTPGAFINFGGTNIYKSDQVGRISELFTLDVIKDGDHIIFADAWHPGIINVKYMAALLNKRVYLHGLWHAGSYDKWDFLGRIIGDDPWIRNFEKSIHSALDYNWFATMFHLNLFHSIFTDLNVKKSFITGWPMSYTIKMINHVNLAEKENIIIYPHRLAPEKRIDLFKKLNVPELSKYQLIIPMELNLSKDEYHTLLKKSKFVVSFAEQETLGISVFEGLCAGCYPIVPDRLSYKEMYPKRFRIPCDSDQQMISATIEKIREVDNANDLMQLSDNIRKTADIMSQLFFTSDLLTDKIESHVQ